MRYLVILLVIICLLTAGCQQEQPDTELTLEASISNDFDADVQPEPQQIENSEETVVEASPELSLDHTQILSEIASVGEQYGATGIQVAVINEGQVVGTYAYGWATKDTDLMTVDHKIRVASISKVIIGITAMLLQEDGIIDLDADIGDYWNVTARNWAYPDTPVTIRSMLTHTSSIISYGDDYSTDYASIRSRLADGYCDTEPGSLDGYYYNNYAFRVLGSTLELAADQRVDDILQEKLFSALDIDASFASGDITDTDMLVTLYRESGEIARSVETQKNIHLSDTPGNNGAYFAGGFTISASDLAKIVALLAADGVYEGQQLLAESSVTQMEEYITEPLSDGSYQAQPLFYVPGLYGRGGIHFHTGSAYGVLSCISYDSDTGDGVVVLTTGANEASEHYGLSYVFDKINSYIYELLSESF